MTNKILNPKNQIKNKFSIINFQFSINYQLINFQLFCHSERSEESLANARFANKWRDSSAFGLRMTKKLTS